MPFQEIEFIGIGLSSVSGKHQSQLAEKFYRNFHHESFEVFFGWNAGKILKISAIEALTSKRNRQGVCDEFSVTEPFLQKPSVTDFIGFQGGQDAGRASQNLSGIEIPCLDRTIQNAGILNSKFPNKQAQFLPKSAKTGIRILRRNFSKLTPSSNSGSQRFSAQYIFLSPGNQPITDLETS